MKVLIVECYANLREVIVRNLVEDNPHLEIIEADNPQTAWRLVEEELPDIVASCIHMRTSKSGIDLLRMIKEIYPYVKVVIFSNYIGYEISPEVVIQMGADAAFPKSFELVNQINDSVSQLQK